MPKENAFNPRPTGSKIKYGAKAVGRTAGSHCTNSSNKSLVQCVARKIQPVRSQTGMYHRKCALPVDRTYGPTINRLPLHNKEKNATSGTLTCPSTFRIPNTPRCRKSLSLIDLSPGGIDHEVTDLRSEGSSSSARMGEVSDRSMDHPNAATMPGQGVVWMAESNSENFAESGAKDVDKAASVICHLLAINAWRRRREEVTDLRETVDELSQQINHLHIQIIVLRRLLHTENCRVEKLGSEFHHAKTQLEEAVRERDNLKIEKEKLEIDLQKLQGESVERSVTAENLRNELMTIQTQLQALDSQISREREKLLKLREDKRILVEKVSNAESLVVEERERATRAEATTEELKEKLKAQEDIISRLQDDNKKVCGDLKKTETEKTRVEKRLRTSEDAGRALSLRAANLEMQLGDREAALRRIESAYKIQSSELTELRERMIRQSQEGGWSSRMLQIAGSVVWAPRAILRSLSFLSSSGAH